MDINDILKAPVLRRVRYYQNGMISGTTGIVSAYRASWVFRQKFVASHNVPESWGFEVETLRHPKEGALALQAMGCPMFKYEVLWERPARARQGAEA